MSKIELLLLGANTLKYAESLYKAMRDDRNFHHFRHTLPSQMLHDGWEAYVAVNDAIPVAWGQIQKFPWESKQHVVRLGLAVPVEFRNQGFGSTMLDHLIQKCESYNKLTATVFANNLIMVKMFEDRNFVTEGRFLDEEREGEISRTVLSMARYQK